MYWLEEYTRAVEDGAIIAGEYLKRMLHNLAEDRFNPRYVYDTTDADRRIGFIEACVRLTKSPFYGQPITLMLWQKAFIEALYSFKMADTGLRRFTEVLLLIARKNAKTETCGALGFDELINGQPGSVIVCSGNNDGDASLIRETIDTMRLFVDPQSLDTSRNTRYISNRINGTVISKLTQTTKSKEGRNIDFAIIDEVHEMQSSAVYDAIKQSTGTKTEPLVIMITSEGYTTGGFLDDRLERGRKVLYGEATDDAAERYLPWLYMQDSVEEVFQDESSWVKSNPSIGVVKRYDYLREQVARAQESRSDRPAVLCKDFNLRQNASEAWLLADDFMYDKSFDIADYQGAYAIGAVDLAETTDLTCAKALLLLPGDEKLIVTRYFIPETKLEASPDTGAGADYARWAQEGWLEIVPGNDLDLSIVADWYLQLYQLYDIRTYIVGYDQKFSRQFTNRMEEIGIDVERVNQNADTLSTAIRLLETDLRARRINYQNNPVDQWCLGNAVIKVNERDQLLIVKPKGQSTRRIDGAVTFAILEEMWRRYRSEIAGLTQ